LYYWSEKHTGLKNIFLLSAASAQCLAMTMIGHDRRADFNGKSFGLDPLTGDWNG